ncbi:MAG: indole-3-glycerol-phosphate synthase [Planctomycetota bacterium]|nr:MAG: indole-3-glycerol-phosphate synthase [Planctomycetota bacterium]
MKPGVVRTGTKLDAILVAVSQRLEERRARIPLSELRSLAESRKSANAAGSRRRSFVEALSQPGLSIIAECKRASPSEGEIAQADDMLVRARSYAADGAAAVSVLTEQDHFGGSLDDFDRVAAAGLPRLRKDFLIDEYMVYESAAHGAEAVLLLANCLDDGLLAELRDLADQLDIAVLLEVHDEPELNRALSLKPECLGVNARDLRSFDTNLGVIEALLPKIDGCLKVAESGIHEWEDIERMRAAGADAVLCGTALMRDPGKLREWSSQL